MAKSLWMDCSWIAILFFIIVKGVLCVSLDFKR